MNASIAIGSSIVTALLAIAPRAQDWTDEQLAAACGGFQSASLATRLQQVGALLAQRQEAFTAIVARIHGDHREYRLKIDRLLDELIDPRWHVRQNAERVLIEVGGRARAEIQQRKENFDVLEQSIRCARILEALRDKGEEQENRELALLRGLVTTALYLDADARLLRALRSALGHTDASITDGALRALGKFGGDDDVDAIAQMIAFKNGLHRQTAIAALGRMRSAKAGALCRQLLGLAAAGGALAGVTPTRTEAMAIVRALHQRDDAGARALLAELERCADPVLAAGARVRVPPATGATKTQFSLPDRTVLDGTFGGFFGESLRADGALPDLPAAELPFADCDTLNFPAHAAIAPAGARVFLNQGTLVSGEVLAIDPEGVRLRSPLFGELTLPRAEVQGIAFDGSLDRLVGASTAHDRLRSKANEFVDGTLLRGDPTTLVMKTAAGAERSFPIADVAGVLFTRPRTTEQDTTIYARLDLVTGERLIGFVADSSPTHVAVCVPMLGAAVLPLQQVTHVELGVGGGAMWGFTLIADYSDNKIVEVDDQGRVVFVLEEVFGAWVAECLDNGNLLITEFSVSRVQEVDRKGKQIWVFEDLKNPYDADRLPNGNTLIADTFASRVIEVDQAGKIVWSFAKEIRPFDCDRLPNGNTLIAEVLKDRVIEVSPSGEIVWEAKGLPHAHDADRLPSGNTLVTLRNKGSVVEIDRDGRIVFEITGLSSPSDADRLPNGNTLVAENTRVREFDRRGNEVWKKEMTWAVEVNRY